MKKFLKKSVSLVSTFAVMTGMVSFAVSAKENNVLKVENSEPNYSENEYGEGYDAFYANGAEITIEASENNDGAVISWQGGKQEVTKKCTVFGGSKATGISGSQGLDSSSITMNGGTVRFIVGGGENVTDSPIENDKSANVENADIKVSGGTVEQSVYGGGYLYSEVGTSNIQIDGVTEASYVVGGGNASVEKNGIKYEAGTQENPKASGNRVDKTTVSITGGNITDKLGEEGSVFGGGEGFSYVGDASVVIDGSKIDGSVVASGSNGYTEASTVVVNKGIINKISLVDKGFIDEAGVLIEEGRVNTVYIGSDSSDKDAYGQIVNGASCVLIGGQTALGQTTVDNLYLGNNGDGKTAESVKPLTIDKIKKFVSFVKPVKKHDSNFSEVTFDTNGGTPEIDSPLVVNGMTTVEPGKKLSKDGYKFNGWYKDKECANAWDFSNTINNDITLYAGWIKDTTDGWNQTVEGWQYIKDGKPITGWTKDIPGWENKYFHFSNDGIMDTGWKTDIEGYTNEWFHFADNGVMDTGWKNNIKGWEGKWFYFEEAGIETGVMARGAKNNIPGYEGKTFKFNDNGTMLTGWYHSWLNFWEYYNEDGTRAEGWKTGIPGYEGKWFYFDVKPTGAAEMTTGWLKLSDGWYCFDDNGIMYSNCKTPDGYHVDKNGRWINLK